MKHFVVATAGHVDHGKSSLVKALTGTDPDRLPEEKARKITIDLGFAELKLRGFDGEEIHASIVDVPGHEDFVRNMIAGVGSIDLALLVIAADDGWMPQTEEHLQILQYLGVERAVVALTKIDIGDTTGAEQPIREQLHATAFANSPMVPVSVRNQIGLDSLRDAIARELANAEPQRDIGKPRLFVDRAFSLRGIGTVVTGTLTAGTLRVTEPVLVQPRSTPARIRSLQSHGRDVDVAQPGTRTAINLPDLAPGSGIARGEVVTTAGFEPTRSVDVLLERSARMQSSAAIKSRSSVYFHHGTSRTLAKIILFDSNSLSAGSKALARLELSEPVLIFVGDRFVVRDGSQQHTVAGGRVLDRDGSTRVYLDRALLSARAATPDDVDVYAKTEIIRAGAIASSQLLRHSRFSNAEVLAALQRLHHRLEIFFNGSIVAESGAWRGLRERAMHLIDAAHDTHPERAGLELNELRSALSEQSSEVVDALIVDLGRDDFRRVGSAIARRSHRATLPAGMARIADSLRERFSANPFDPPPRKQLAGETQTQQALKFLIEQNEIVEISDDVVLCCDAYSKMKSEIAEFIWHNGPATVSQLRQALRSSRRVIVPLLEKLDREGFTRRVGDERTLAQQIASAKLANASNAPPG